jgi:large subunit ribosomal protein L21
MGADHPRHTATSRQGLLERVTATTALRAVVQSPFVPTPSSALSAVVVSGGKQYRVAAGDRILVDRIKGEPGDEIAIDRVLLVSGDEQVKVLPEELQGITVTAKVLQHQRGPKIDVLRYKPKKRVRVHRGARADLTALEILSVGGEAKPAETKRKRAARAAAPKDAAEETEQSDE